MPYLPSYAMPGARNLGGLYNQPGMPPLVPPTQPSDAAPLVDLSEIDEAVRRFNETAANLPVGAFGPGGNFWAQQAAGLAANRQAATNEANDWINQQLGQRMPGGVAPGPEAGRLGLSADPRYGAQFPGRPPAPTINQQFVDQANAAAPQIGAGGFIHVGPNSGLEPLRPEAGPQQDMSPAAAAALRARQLRQRLDSDPAYQEWKTAAQAAGADAMAKGLPGPQLKGPTFVGDAFRSEADQARFKAAAAAFADRRADRRDRLMAQMEQRRAAAAINNLRDPQTRNAVLAAGLFGGQMPQNAAIALQMMGYPDAAKFVAQSQLAAQESADRRYGVDKGLEAEELRTYRRDLENWENERRDYNTQINALISGGQAATRDDAEYLLGRQGVTLRPRPTRPGQAGLGGSVNPQSPEPAAAAPQQGSGEIPRTRQDEVILGNDLRKNASPDWFVSNYQRLQRLPKKKRAEILRDSITTEDAQEAINKASLWSDSPEEKVAPYRELAEIFGLKLPLPEPPKAHGGLSFMPLPY